MITTAQKQWTKDGGWQEAGGKLGGQPQLVFVFGSSSLVSQADHFKEAKGFYPDAHIVSCSTAGQILGTKVSDDSLDLTAIHFEDTELKVKETDIERADDSEKVGRELGEALPKESLVHVMIFSDGLNVNGTALVNGLRASLPASVSATGGLVGDGSDFKHTYVGLDHVAEEGKVVVVGFYGSKLRVGYGSLGGWDAFGPERTITKSKNNILGADFERALNQPAVFIKVPVGPADSLEQVLPLRWQRRLLTEDASDLPLQCRVQFCDFLSLLKDGYGHGLIM